MIKLSIIFYLSKIDELYMNSRFFEGFTKFHLENGSNVRYILTFIFLISQINEIKKNVFKNLNIDYLLISLFEYIKWKINYFL